MDEWLLNALKSISVHWDGILCGVFFGFSTVCLRLKMIEHYVARRNVKLFTRLSKSQLNRNGSLVSSSRVRFQYCFSRCVIVTVIITNISFSSIQMCWKTRHSIKSADEKNKKTDRTVRKKEVNKSNQLVKLVR